MNREIRRVRRICGSEVDSGQPVRLNRLDAFRAAAVDGSSLRSALSDGNPLNSHLERYLAIVAERESLARKRGYRRRELARLCQISPRQLERYFRRRFGRTPQEWLEQLRLKDPVDLILQGIHVKQIAFELGFAHPSHFIRKFKQWYGCTPMKLSLGNQAETFAQRLSPP